MGARSPRCSRVLLWSILGDSCMPAHQGRCKLQVRPQELASSGRSITTLFTPDDWEYHQTTSRYFRNLLNIGGSAVFRRCLAVRCLRVAVTSFGTQPACRVRAEGKR